MAHLIILGMRYEVLEVPEDHKELKSDNGDAFFGTITHTTNKIHIMKGLNRTRKTEVLLHEIIHAVSAELGLDLSEKMVKRLTMGLVSSGVQVKAIND